nr:MAG TPA: hypothetical protein [Caudoviricetes sp.]
MRYFFNFFCFRCVHVYDCSLRCSLKNFRV